LNMKEFINKNHLYIRIAISVMLTIMALFVIKGKFVRQLTSDFNDATKESSYIALDDQELKQYFTVNKTIQTFDLIVKGIEDEQEKDITLKLSLYHAKKDTLIGESVIQTKVGPEESVAHFPLELSDADFPEGKKTKLYFTLTLVTGDNTALSVTESEYDEKFFVDGIAKDYQGRFSVGFGTVKYPGMLLLVGTLIFVVLLFLLMQVQPISKRLKVEYIFLILALTGGIGMAVINPPSQECDGWEHYLRSVDVSYGNVLAPFVNLNHEKGVITVPKNINSFQFQVIDPGSQSGNTYLENLKQMKFAGEVREMKYESIFVSLFYIPQGMGLFVGRILGLSMYTSVVMARILNLIVYVLLTFFAIRKIPCGKNLLMLVALLPLSLYQSASCSPDAVLHGLSFLFLALCLYYAYGTEEVKKPYHGLILGVLLGLLFMCKYIYICMGLLVFLIPKKRFKDNKGYTKAFILAMIPLLIIVTAMLPYLTGSVGHMSAAQNEGMTQLQFVTSNPVNFIKILCTTMLDKFEIYVEWLNTLGWMNYSLTPLTVIIPCFLTVIGVIDTNAVSAKIKLEDRVILFFTFLVCTAVMMLGLYISDGRINPVGSNVILGVQGRYFIPVLILPFLALGSRKLKNHIDYFSMKTASVIGICLIYTEWVLIRSCY